MKAGFRNIIIVLLWSVSPSWSQVDSIAIPEITIADAHYRSENIGGQKATFSSADLDSLQPISIIELLSEEEGIYFKNYGPNTLSTPSLRGGSAGHTLVLWNGMPISSPMLGLLDYSLLPVESMDNVSLVKGGNSALWGSGAISGVIDMQNDIKFINHTGFSIHSSYGSWNSWQQNAQFSWSNDRFYTGTQVQYLKADNDFPYRITESLPSQNLDNGQAEKLDLMQHIGYKISDRSKLIFHYWLQAANREIPPTIVQTQNTAYQEDLSNRLLMSFQNNRNKGVFKMSSAFFQDKINFFDKAESEALESLFSSWLNDINYQHHFSSESSLFLGVNYTWTRAEAEGYRDNRPMEHKVSLLTSYTYRKKKWVLKASNRLEMVNSDLLPVTPQLGIDYTPNKIFRLAAKLSRDYRIPTLNDRYWRPGGNPDLLAESGWSQELTLAAAIKNGGIEITGYNRSIDNWILWIPSDDSFFWSAHNIKEVWSRGLESKMHWSKAIKSIDYKVMVGYNLVHSTYQFDLSLPDIDKGDQLFYTPKNTFYGRVSTAFKNVTALYNHRYNSKSLGVNEDVNAYHVGSVKVDYQWGKGDFRSHIYFHLENIWNERYYVVERRPMPGINIRTGIKIYFNK